MLSRRFRSSERLTRGSGRDCAGFVRAISPVLVLLSLLALVVVGEAQDQEKEPPCLADMQRWCANVPPAGAYVQQCLEHRSAQLSERCSRHVGEVTRNRVHLTDACRADLCRLCSGVIITAGAPTGCLVRNREKLSDACRKTLDKQSED